MSKKDKLDKVAEFVVEKLRTDQSAADTAVHLYKQEPDGFRAFIWNLFGLDNGDDILFVVEDRMHTQKCAVPDTVNWRDFMHMVISHGINDSTDCLRISRADDDTDDFVYKVFEKVREELSNRSILNIDFKTELRTPYSIDTVHTTIRTDTLMMVNSLRTLRELLYNAVYNSIKELECEVMSKVKTYADNNQLALPNIIAEQYADMIDRLTDSSTRNRTRPLRNSISKELSSAVYANVAMIVGTIFGMIVKDGHAPIHSTDYMTVNDIGTGYSMISISSVSVTVSTVNGLMTETYEGKFAEVDDPVNREAINSINNKDPE